MIVLADGKELARVRMAGVEHERVFRPLNDRVLVLLVPVGHRNLQVQLWRRRCRPRCRLRCRGPGLMRVRLSESASPAATVFGT
jgi:hypothetical protein